MCSLRGLLCTLKRLSVCCGGQLVITNYQYDCSPQSQLKSKNLLKKKKEKQILKIKSNGADVDPLLRSSYFDDNDANVFSGKRNPYNAPTFLL